MSRDRDNDRGIFEPLWSGRDKERDRQTDDKVLPLKPPGEWGDPLRRSSSDRTYTAFDAQDQKPARLHIRTAKNGSLYPSYHYLADFRFGHDLESILTLVYTFMTVEITGRNLAPVARALQYEACAAIYEYHPQLYDPPAENEPVIEAIHVTTADEKPKPR